MKSSSAPVAVFAYRRAGALAEVMSSLSACEGFHDAQVTVFVDGPKTDEDRKGVGEVRELLAGLDWPNLSVVFSEENRGLKRSIFDGVSRILEEYDRVIILEDDLVLSPLALLYFNSALEKYDSSDSVWSVAGYMYNVPEFVDRDTALVLPFAHPWGWATWRRAWSQFSIYEEIPQSNLVSKTFRTRFDLGIRGFSEMLSLAKEGKVNSWFILWYLRIFRSNGVSIFPPVSYIKNNGIGGGGGTHSSRLNPYSLLTRRADLANKNVEMPRCLDVDYLAIDSIAGSWDANIQKLIGKIGAIRRRWR